MECGGSRRSGLLTAGGVFSILAGTLEVIGGGTAVALLTSPSVQHALLDPLRLVAFPPVWPVVPTWLIIAGVPLMVLGVMAILGGVSAIRRKSFRQSLAGAICALPSVIVGWYLVGAAATKILFAVPLAMVIWGLALVISGIPAVIFVSLSKREFGAQGTEYRTAGRRKLLTTGGVLSIIGGGLEVVGGGILVALVIAHRDMFGLVGHGVWGGTPVILFGPYVFVDLIALIKVGVALLVLGIAGVVGGVSAVRRRIFGLSLAGAICALPSVILSDYLGWLTGVGLTNAALTLLDLGILALIFVSLSKREFGAERKVNGI
jgi:hypothetical protein